MTGKQWNSFLRKLAASDQRANHEFIRTKKKCDRKSKFAKDYNRCMRAARRRFESKVSSNTRLWKKTKVKLMKSLVRSMK